MVKNGIGRSCKNNFGIAPSNKGYARKALKEAMKKLPKEGSP